MSCKVRSYSGPETDVFTAVDALVDGQTYNFNYTPGSKIFYVLPQDLFANGDFRLHILDVQ